jgi:spore coat protein U-like protein
VLALVFAANADAQGITNLRPLAFGELSAGLTSGTAVVTPSGTRTFMGGVTPGNSGGVTSAAFLVLGIPLLTYSISLPGSVVLSAGANTMTVNTFTSNPSGTGQLTVIGVQTLTVGATLQVGASQSSGSYTGTFDVTVVYN